LDLSASIAIGFAALAITALIQIAGLLIWGASLTQRVKRLEDEVTPLKALPERLGRVEEKLDGLVEQIKDLNASIRWMRDPADYGPRHER
jgi:hypothetical protein